MKRTRKQIINIKKGCAKANKQLIVTAQKKRHLRAKINQLIISKANESNTKQTLKYIERLNNIIKLKGNKFSIIFNVIFQLKN